MEEELLKDVMRLLDEDKSEEVISVIDDNRKNITTKYHEFNIIYIQALIKLGKLDDALNILEEEISMPYIPAAYEKRYNELYQSVLILTKENLEDVAYTDKEIRRILTSRPLPEEFILMVLKLGDKNIRNYIDEIKDLIADPDVANLNKLLLLSALKGQEVSLDFNFVSKYGSKVINSSFDINNLESEIVDGCFLLLDDCSKDFNLIEVSKKNLMGILVALLPLEVGEDDLVDLVATAYYKACHMLGNNISKNALLNKFKNVNLDKVDYFESIEVE